MPLAPDRRVGELPRRSLVSRLVDHSDPGTPRWFTPFRWRGLAHGVGTTGALESVPRHCSVVREWTRTSPCGLVRGRSPRDPRRRVRLLFGILWMPRVAECGWSQRPLRTEERARASRKQCKKYSQAIKSQRWMPWRQMPMKDVGGCEKPRGAVDRASIRGCPNGETRLGSCPVTPA
jgi:hypothetical protein